MKKKIIEYWSKIPELYQERIKEVGRWFVLGILSYLITENNLSLVAVKTIILRIIDRAIHLWGKKEDIEWVERGLTRF